MNALLTLLAQQDPSSLTAAVEDPGEPWYFWLGFGLFVVFMLLLDLFVFHKKPHEVKTKEAVGWSIFWIALALLFNAILIPWLGPQKAKEFLAAYVLEKSLSVDNLFVIVLIFQYFRVPGEYQHKVLFYGILGAILMRLAFVLAGAELLKQFTWTALVFGGILVVTGIKLLFGGGEDADPSKSRIVQWVKRVIPSVDEYHGQSFTIVKEGKRYATPLLLVLVVIELTDLVFAVDSVPACLAVSKDTFIVFTSNIFAILGLRALYFLLARFLGSFHYLKYGLALVLGFVGVKMAMTYWGKHVDSNLSLAVICGVLGIATALSFLFPKKTPGNDTTSPAP